MQTKTVLTTLAVAALMSWTLIPSASAQADLQSRTFTDAASAELDFNEGAGIFDSTVPGTGVGDQTCAALLSADVGASILVAFYLNGRVVAEGQAGLGNLVPNTVVASDITECATFTPGFTGDIGTDDIDNDNIGGYIIMSPIASNTIFPGSETADLDSCETGDGATGVILTAPDKVSGCVGTAAALFSGAGAGANWDTSFYATGFAGTNGGIVNVCVSANIFDPMALAFVTVDDADYFALIGNADAPTGIANTLTQHTPDVWSAINANGC